MEKEFLYLALIPDTPMYNEFWCLKNYYGQKYESTKALSSPPHITMVAPFHSDKKQELLAALRTFCNNYKVFEVELKDYGYFDKQTAFIKVKKNHHLADFQLGVSQIVHGNNNDQGKFTPHLTLVNRDISEENFDKLKKELDTKTFRRKYFTRHLSLLKHNGKHWYIDKKIRLKPHLGITSYLSG